MNMRWIHSSIRLTHIQRQSMILDSILVTRHSVKDLTLLLIIVGFWHMHVGLRVIIEDYIHKPLSKAALLLLNMFVCGLGGALAVFSILKVALSASGLDGGAL